MIKWARSSPSVFAYYKRSKTGRWESLGWGYSFLDDLPPVFGLLEERAHNGHHILHVVLAWSNSTASKNLSDLLILFLFPVFGCLQVITNWKWDDYNLVPGPHGWVFRFLIIFDHLKCMSYFLIQCYFLSSPSLFTWLLRCDVCLMYPPYLIALACIHMAAVVNKKDVKGWFAELSVDMGKILEITTQILDLYRLWYRQKPHLERPSV